MALLPIERYGIGLALKTGVSYRTAAQRLGADAEGPGRPRRLDRPFATAILSLAPVETVALNLNLGIEHDRTETRSAPTWGLGVAWAVLAPIA